MKVCKSEIPDRVQDSDHVVKISVLSNSPRPAGILVIVVSDTSPLSPLTALLTVGETEILSTLWGEVIIPEMVRDELLRNHSLLPPSLRVEQ